MGRLTNIFESLLLSEGRKEKAREKYPMFNDIVFNHYVDADPSGNHKYLDWMLGTTVADSKNYSDDRGYNVLLRPDKRPVQYHNDMVKAIQFFHENQQRFHAKDINKYSSLSKLEDVIKLVKEKIEAKRLEKEAKKNRDVIHNDERWLVVSPKSHKASCYYGAGTKWCVTSKQTAVHWTKYSRNATFLFILDKTKTIDDPLYKVAFRKIGRGDRYELWDATDSEFSSIQKGRDYLLDIPQEILRKMEDYHRVNFPEYKEGEIPEIVKNSPKAQALSNHMGTTDIELVDTTGWYGHPVFEVDGEFWAVTSYDDMGDALYEYYDEYSDDDLAEYDYDGYYLLMHDEDGFIDNEVEYYVNEASDNELLEMSGDIDYYNELEEKIEDSENDEEIDSLRSEMEELVDDARDSYVSSLTDEWERCFRGGPVECLVNEKGWYRDSRELYNAGIVYLDREGLIESITDYGDWDILTPYGYDEEDDFDNESWVVFQVDY
jgi:hypothetical protein